MKHAAPEPTPAKRRRWWRSPGDEGSVTIDLRERTGQGEDPVAVIARLARLRDARLLTQEEFEAESRAIIAAAAWTEPDDAGKRKR